MKGFRVILALIQMAVIISVLTGCGAASKKKTASFENLYCSGQFKEATETALDNNELDDDVILWNLQASSAYLAAGEYKKFCDTMDHVEALCKMDDLQNSGVDTLETAGEILTNNYINDYRPKLYDKILINTYKGLAFIGQGDADNARIEFNRAYDRQRRTLVEYRSEIKEAEEAIEKKKENKPSDSETQKFDFNKAVKDAMATVEKKNNVQNWTPYKDFVNPFTTYLSGLYWIVYGEGADDYDKAVAGLQRLEQISPSPAVEKDLALAESRVGGGALPNDQVWVVFENGLGPELEEFRFDLPLFVLGKKSPVKMVSLALPLLKPREPAYSALKIVYDGNCTCETYPLADMDQVVATEYDANFEGMVAKAVSSMLVKSAGQYAATKAAGELGGLLMGAFNTFTTEADLRMWTTLPKDVQVGRLTRPADGRLELQSPDGVGLSSVVIPEDTNVLVYVRIPTKETQPAVNVIPLSPRG